MSRSELEERAEELLNEAMIKERALERVVLWDIEKAVEGEEFEGIERISSFLFQVRVQESEHAKRLLDMADEVGVDLDLHEVNKLAFEEAERCSEEIDSVGEGLRYLLEKEREGEEFYLEASEEMREMEEDDVNAHVMALRFSEIARDENRHTDRVQELLELPGVEG